jgi:hypothetical protein
LIKYFATDHLLKDIDNGATIPVLEQPMVMSITSCWRAGVVPSDEGRRAGHRHADASHVVPKGVTSMTVSVFVGTSLDGFIIQRFLEAGLVQRLIITRVPVLIGDGIPLFGILQRDIRLRHVATEQYASGLVKSEYAVAAFDELEAA